MTGAEENAFKPKLGRIRHQGGAKRAKSYLSRVVTAMNRAGPGPSLSPRAKLRGRPARSYARRVVVKARIVKLKGVGARAQQLHLRYIQRDAAAREGEQGMLYDHASDDVDGKDFEKRGAGDRHQFRFIVSPEDGAELTDLKPFTRDLMTAMEKDLETRLDWVAADHYDTAHPHVHIVVGGKRQDGGDLVIPRKYISFGMRERASELVSLELGPQTELEMRRKLASEVSQDRFTRLDRQLVDLSDEGALDLGAQEDRQTWRRRLQLARLKKLTNQNLAKKTGRMQWRLSPQLQPTLRRMGERGDIIKTLSRAHAERSLNRRVEADAVYDPTDRHAKPVIGRVLSTGVTGEMHDRAYARIDSVDGRSRYVDLGALAGRELPTRDQIVHIAPALIAAKPADSAIARIAARNNGRYSAGAHLKADSGARPEYIAAHIRRLEALRRAGHVERLQDGAWTIPDDYLNRAENYERARAQAAPVRMKILSRLSLEAQQRTIGVTWLDRQMSEGAVDEIAHAGFGGETRAAMAARRAFLMREGLIRQGEADKQLPASTLRQLERRDLDAAADHISRQISKPYSELQRHGKIEGVYSHSIDRPSGRYAVIERAKDFTLAPW